MSPVSIALTAGEASASVDVAAGGRLAQILVAGEPLLVEPTPDDPLSTGWGSFPMAPFPGRIRHGRFRFLGNDVVLDTNHDDGDRFEDTDEPERYRHAIHGTVFARAWTVVDRGDAHLTLTCPLAGGLGWPFGGTARQHLALTADALSCELSIETDDRPFPGDVGWHPWFRKPAALDFTPAAMYRRDTIGLTTGELVPPTDGPWDDCFVAAGPVRLRYDRPAASVVTVDSDCDHWVVYDEPPHATCVEPQSGPPDSVTIRPRVVVPGVPLHRWMTISW